MGRFVKVMAWVSATAAVVGFFLPWMNLEVRESKLSEILKWAAPTQEDGALNKGARRITATIRTGAQTITGEIPSVSDIPDRVSGFEIPRLANKQEAKVAVALMEMLSGQRQHMGAKSYAVYFLPSVAVLCAGLVTAKGKHWPIAVGVAFLCALIFGIGVWKLLTFDAEKLVVALTIGPGLWLSLAAYLGLSLAALIDTFSPESL